MSIDAVGRRIMNPFNGSFSFLVDALPPNTPLRVNIYAQNSRKRSPGEVELDARTLRAAERRIDYAQQGGGDSAMTSTGDTVARGRKASFFEELYGGYGRFRSKHLVVGLLIGAVAVAVFVAILLIVIASIRNKSDTRSSRHSQAQETRLTSFDGTTGAGAKQKMGARKCSQSRESICQSATLHLEDFKESAFITSSNEDEGALNGGGDMLIKSCHNPTQMHSSTVDILAGGATGAAIYDYSHYGALCDGEDDSSMRSDHQLIQQTNMMEGNSNKNNSNCNGSKSYYHRSRGPPSYFDLEQSVALNSSDTAPRAFVNLISSGGGGSVQEAKPDLIQTATIYSNAGAKDPNSAIFDTISFENHRGHMTGTGECNDSGNEAYLNEINEMGPTMIAVTGEQISGKWSVSREGDASSKQCTDTKFS